MQSLQNMSTDESADLFSNVQGNDLNATIHGDTMSSNTGRWIVKRVKETAHESTRFGEFACQTDMSAWVVFETVLKHMEDTMTHADDLDVHVNEYSRLISKFTREYMERQSVDVMNEIATYHGFQTTPELLEHTAIQALAMTTYVKYVDAEDLPYFEVTDRGDDDEEEEPEENDDDSDDEERVNYSELAEMLVIAGAECFVTSNGECDLCSNDIEPLVTLPCEHSFGLTCLKRWTLTRTMEGDKTTCPMCRAIY